MDIVLLFSFLGGLAVFLIVYALFVRPLSRAPRLRRGQRAAMSQYAGIQVRLDRAQIDMRAEEYVARSLRLGVLLGLGLWIVIGAVALAPLGLLAGFLFEWSRLERERDLKMVRYAKQLASTCDTITNAYSVKGSMKAALEAAVEYSPSPIKEDFAQILVEQRQGRLAEALQTVADRRRSIVFDTVATALLRADEGTGQVKDMLKRLASSTRENVAVFEDAMTMQINARSNIQWGAYGPWLIFAVFRGMTTLLALGSGANLFGGMATFFSTLEGNLVAAAAAIITMLLYTYAYRIAQRGMVVRRVATADTIDATVVSGQTAGQERRGQAAQAA